MFVTFCLTWLLIGSIIWAVFFGSAAFEEWRISRLASRGMPCVSSIVMTSVLFILVWPLAVAAVIGGWMRMRRVTR